MDGSSKVRDVSIERDSTFFRATADNVIVMPLGRDVELAFIAVSPKPIANRFSVDASGEEGAMSAIQIEHAFVEVARLRMAPEAVSVMAVQLAQRAVEAGMTIDHFVENVRHALNANLKPDGTYA